MIMEGNDILQNGFDRANYSNNNKIALLIVFVIVLLISTIASISIAYVASKEREAYEFQILQRDSLNAELKATNDLLNYNLINHAK
jgi:hypothetical protein